MKKFKINDKVAYSSSFLKSTQAHELGALRGVVAQVYVVSNRSWVKVVWSDGETRTVIGSNLRTVKSLHTELF